MVDTSPLRDSATFRRLFVGRTILIFGVGLVGITVPLDMYARTGASGHVGLVASVEAVGFLAGFLSGGVLADRADRWTVLPWSVVLCALAFTGLTVNALWFESLWPIYLCVAANGVFGGIGITAVLAVLPSVVGRERLHAVGALNTLSIRFGSVLSPLIGGVAIAASGAAWNYGAAAVCGLFSVLLFQRPREELPSEVEAQAGSTPDGPLRSLRLGYRFILQDRVVLGVMTAGIVGMVGGGVFVLVPAFVDARLGGSAGIVGLVYSALSVGLIVGAVCSGWVREATRPGLLLLLMMVLSFCLYTVAGLSSSVVLVVLFAAVAGVALSVEEVLRYALLQQHTPDELLGRVNSAFAAQNMSGAAVGALVAAVFSRLVGPSDAFWIYNATMVALSMVALAALPVLRRTPGGRSLGTTAR